MGRESETKVTRVLGASGEAVGGVAAKESAARGGREMPLKYFTGSRPRFPSFLLILLFLHH